MVENQIQIPEGWKSSTINDLCIISRGRVISQTEIFNKVGVYPVYSSQSQNNGEMGRIDTFDFDGDYVTWTTDGAYAGTVFFRTGKFNCTNVCGTLKEKEANTLDLQFLAYLLSTEAKYHVSYVGNPKLMNGVMAKILLQLPKDKTEQTTIANILSKTDQAIAHTEALIAKYTQIKTGLMQDLLTKGIDENGNIRTEQTHEFKDSLLGRIPKELECEIIDNIYDLRSGITPLRSNKKYFSDEGYNWVKTLDLNEDYLYSTEEKISQFALDSISIQLMPINSILIAMYGGWEQIGRTSIIKKEAATNQAITCLYNPKKVMNADYVQLVLQQYRYKWKQYAVSTRKDPNITKTDIKNFILAFPIDVKEQDKIVDRIMKTKDFISKSKTELTKLQSLKTGLMQDLLSGKVRVNNLMKEKQN